jgi:hypothetical protein
VLVIVWKIPMLFGTAYESIPTTELPSVTVPCTTNEMLNVVICII